MLQRFGVLFGYRNVVLYVEPVAYGGALTTNTARTTLLLNGDKLPWEDWAYEFRENMPKRLADFVSEKASGLTEKDHISSIKDRLKNVMDLYKVSRYDPRPRASTCPTRRRRFASGRLHFGSKIRRRWWWRSRGRRDELSVSGTARSATSITCSRRRAAPEREDGRRTRSLTWIG